MVRREIGELTRECTRCWLSFLGGSAARKGVSYVQELLSEGSGSLQLRHVLGIRGGGGLHVLVSRRELTLALQVLM